MGGATHFFKGKALGTRLHCRRPSFVWRPTKTGMLRRLEPLFCSEYRLFFEFLRRGKWSGWSTAIELEQDEQALQFRLEMSLTSVFSYYKANEREFFPVLISIYRVNEGRSGSVPNPVTHIPDSDQKCHFIHCLLVAGYTMRFLTLFA